MKELRELICVPTPKLILFLLSYSSLAKKKEEQQTTNQMGQSKVNRFTRLRNKKPSFYLYI